MSSGFLKMMKPKKIRARTECLREKFKAAGLPMSPIEDEDKAARLATVIRDGEFGCRTESVYKLVEAILHMDIPRLPASSEIDKPMKKGSVVMYFGQTYLITGFDEGGDMLGVSNKMSPLFNEGDGSCSGFLQACDDYRPAAPEEVESFLVDIGVVKPKPVSTPV